MKGKPVALCWRWVCSLTTAAGGGGSLGSHTAECESPRVCPCPGWLGSPNSDLAPSFLPLLLTSSPTPTHKASKWGKGGETLGWLVSKTKMLVWGINNLSVPLLIAPQEVGEYKQWEEVGRKSKINSSC